MKASELKIGDIVNFGGEKAKVVGISSEDKDSITIQCLENGGENRIWRASLLDEIDGIPLTEEVLKKSGWRKSGYMSVEGRESLYHLGSAMDKDRIVICFQAQGVFLEMWQGHNIVRKEIKYVHQLQHLLWALGIENGLKI